MMNILFIVRLLGDQLAPMSALGAFREAPCEIINDTAPLLVDHREGFGVSMTEDAGVGQGLAFYFRELQLLGPGGGDVAGKEGAAVDDLRHVAGRKAEAPGDVFLAADGLQPFSERGGQRDLGLAHLTVVVAMDGSRLAGAAWAGHGARVTVR